MNARIFLSQRAQRCRVFLSCIVERTIQLKLPRCRVRFKCSWSKMQTWDYDCPRHGRSVWPDYSFSKNQAKFKNHLWDLLCVLKRLQRAGERSSVRLRAPFKKTLQSETRFRISGGLRSDFLGGYTPDLRHLPQSDLDMDRPCGQLLILNWGIGFK